ncbi:hypothetical protein Hoch_4599 [Haliangium ochraceum DSM 14365]|uniref:Uncharacterized protein n=2 Tax=Haliangium ochraceum TaxID=80816 RepID=D0LQ53_HALO1|nr:hypothetical protein Hoch_4599 [Haliangium ochraceum DSM 14365]
MAAIGIAAGCGSDDEPTPIDAPGAPADAGIDGALPVADAALPDGPPADARELCYPGGGTPSDGAEVEIGRALVDDDRNVNFEPIAEDEEFEVYAGAQGGYHVFLYARARGIDFGDGQAPVDDEPATKFHVYTADGTDVTLEPCAYPRPYIDGTDGYDQLPFELRLLVSASAIDDLIGQQFRIAVEITDRYGNYAVDERTVTGVLIDER